MAAVGMVWNAEVPGLVRYVCGLIGSGPVEAACKQVVGQRMEGSGMRWGEAGADAVCHLRALLRSEKGQWDHYWASLAA